MNNMSKAGAVASRLRNNGILVVKIEGRLDEMLLEGIMDSVRDQLKGIPVDNQFDCILDFSSVDSLKSEAYEGFSKALVLFRKWGVRHIAAVRSSVVGMMLGSANMAVAARMPIVDSIAEALHAIDKLRESVV